MSIDAAIATSHSSQKKRFNRDMSNKEKAELRYRETMEAISLWLDGQAGKGSPAEAIGIAKAFLTHAALAIALSATGCDESDAQRLKKRLFEVVVQFIKEHSP